MSVLELASVTVRVGRGEAGPPILREVTLSVTAGEVVVLLGPSGSGKSSLLSTAAGLLAPAGGTVRVEGVEISSLSPSRRRATVRGRVGLIFQRFLLLPELSAVENVVVGLRLAGLHWSEAGRRGRELLERLGLGAKLHVRPNALSMGEQQRVAIARAMGAAPRLLLADEPTASLDWSTGRAALEEMVGLARDAETAVLLATHDERTLAFGTRALRLKEGRLVAFDAPEGTRPAPAAALAAVGEAGR